MPGGRPPKPTHLHIVEGTARARHVNRDEPAPLAGLPLPPAWLSTRGAEIFREQLGYIDGMRLASSGEVAVHALFASRLEEVEICTTMIEDGGRTFTSAIEKDDSGQVVSQQIKANPAVAQRSEAMRHAQSLAAEFGLSPASRCKVSAVKKAQAGNEFATI